MPQTAPSPAPDAAARALALVDREPRRLLEPTERFAEIVFGLVMVLTFTGTLRVAEGGREQVRELLVAALSCNLAWGIVDGVMFVVTSVAGRTRRLALLQGVRAAGPDAARAILRASLPRVVAPLLHDVELDRIVLQLRELPAAGERVGVTLRDLGGALACFLLTLAATVPPTLPFLVAHDVHRAVHLSNAAAVASLFLAGFGLGRANGGSPWRLGFAMVLVGVALVLVTIALGG